MKSPLTAPFGKTTIPKTVKIKKSINFDSQKVKGPDSLELSKRSVTDNTKENKLTTEKATSQIRHPFRFSIYSTMEWSIN